MNFIKYISLIFLFGFSTLSFSDVHALNFVSTDQGIFFNQELGQKIKSYKSFPLNWWNFLVFDLNSQTLKEDWEEARSVCQRINDNTQHLILRAECGTNISQYQNMVKEWVYDYPLRHDKPADSELSLLMNKVLAKATLPLDKSMLSLLRHDPFGAYQELKELIEHRIKLKTKQKKGYFFDEVANRLVIPIQFSFSPEEDGQTALFQSQLREICSKRQTCDQWRLIGAHASTLENKDQIKKDMQIVTFVGMIVLCLFCGGLIYLRRGRLLLLTPVVFVSVLFGMILTVLFFGSIHGLTISFGTGIIGLGFDYGFHATLNIDKKTIWKSNLMGLLTTLVVLVVLYFSQIPLIKQIMFFSVSGLLFSFVFFFFLIKNYSGFFKVDPIYFVPTGSIYKGGFVVVVLAGLLISFFGLDLKLDLSSFDFQNNKGKEIRTWLFSSFNSSPPLFEIQRPAKEHDAFSLLHEKLTWALDNDVGLENAARYYPNLTQQQKHLETWRKDICHNDKWIDAFNEDQQKFFKPFFYRVKCSELSVNHLDDKPHPLYIKDFYANQHWITLWFPKKSGADKDKIQNRFPGVTSLKDVVNIFPDTLLMELKWMGPLSFLLIVGLLFYYYKNVLLTFMALVPFFTGMGMISWIHFLFNMELSFVSLIAVIMVCGISVDYGIFATDITKNSIKNSSRGVWTALLFAAITTISGFIPLAFCQHKVLAHLGQTLTCGMIGTVIGTFWGIPFFVKRWVKNR